MKEKVDMNLAMLIVYNTLGVGKENASSGSEKKSRYFPPLMEVATILPQRTHRESQKPLNG